MTESRDEFRQRISDVMWDGMERSEYEPEMIGRLVDGLEALYGQALADMVRKFEEAHLEMVVGLVREWADEIGLDLEEQS